MADPFSMFSPVPMGPPQRFGAMPTMPQQTIRPQPQMASPMGGGAPPAGFEQWLQQNPGMVMQLAAGMMGGRQALPQALANMPAAMKLDSEAARRKRQEAALGEYTKSRMDSGAVSPETAKLWEAFPEQAAAQAFASPPATDDIKEYNFAKSQGYSGTLTQFMTEMRRAGATNVNVGGGEPEFDKTVGKGFGEEYLSTQKEARKAQDALSSLSVMEQSMADPNFYSGTGSGVVLAYKRGIAALGGDPSGAVSMEAFNAQAKKAALDNMGGSLGSGFSNADRDFVIQQVPTLQNTPEGNKKLVEINKAIQKRKLNIAAIARQYAQRHKGRIDQGFYDVLEEWADANPIFPAVDPTAVSGPPAAGGIVNFTWSPETGLKPK